jgi:hypothetical protein
VFEKTRQRPATLALLLRGIGPGAPTARLAPELGLSRKQLHTLRRRIHANLNDTAPTSVMAGTALSSRVTRASGASGSATMQAGTPATILLLTTCPSVASYSIPMNARVIVAAIRAMPRSQDAGAVLCRQAMGVWRAHRAWTAAKVAALTLAGPGIEIPSAGGAGRRVCPGRTAAGRTHAGPGRVRPL